MTSQIEYLGIDPPFAFVARYQLNFVDRRYLDDQIRGIQKHIVTGLINGTYATWVTLDSGSAAVVAGDVVCLAGSTTSVPKVTKATSGAITAAGSVFGVVYAAAAPGSKVLVATGGVVSPTVTGLAAASGACRLNASSGRCQKVSSFSNGDYVIGSIDSRGWLAVAPAAFVYASGGGSDNDAPPASIAIPALNIDWSAGETYRKTLSSGSNTFTFSNQADGMTIVVALTGSSSTVTWPGGVKWAGGTPPTQTASGTDIYTFVNMNGTIYGSVVQAMA